MQTASAVFKRSKVAKLAFGCGDPIGAPEEQTELHDVRRIGDGVGCAFLDGAEKQASVFGIAENENRRMGWLGVDVIKKAEADFFRLLVRMAQVEQDYVGPGEEFLELIHPAAAVGAKSEAVAKRPRDRFSQTAVMTEEGNLK